MSPSQLDGGKFHLVIPGASFPRVTSEFRNFMQGMPGCPWAGSGGTYWSLQISPERLTAPASMALWNQRLHAKTVPHTGQGTLYLRLLKGPCAWGLHTAILWGVDISWLNAMKQGAPHPNALSLFCPLLICKSLWLGGEYQPPLTLP